MLNSFVWEQEELNKIKKQTKKEERRGYGKN